MREKRHKVEFCADIGQDLYVDGDSAAGPMCREHPDELGQVHRLRWRDSRGSTTRGQRGRDPHLRQWRRHSSPSCCRRSSSSSSRAIGHSIARKADSASACPVVKRLDRDARGLVEASSAGEGNGRRSPCACQPSKPTTATLKQRQPHAIEAQRILIVDDNADAADSLSLLLKMDGHTTRAVYDSQTALDAAGGLRPQHRAARHRATRKSMATKSRGACARGGSRAQIIALTGYGQREDQVRSRDAGFDAHLVKPVDLQVLRQTLGASRHGLRSSGRPASSPQPAPPVFHANRAADRQPAPARPSGQIVAHRSRMCRISFCRNSFSTRLT